MSLTFGSTFNLSDIFKTKAKLNKVNYTVHTRADGTKYRQNNQDGTCSDLASESQDENGSWAILDEASALGLGKDETTQTKPQTKPPTSTKPLLDNNAKLTEILKQYPQLSQYLILFKVGVPPTTIRSKIFDDGVAATLPENMAQEFCECIGAPKDAVISLAHKDQIGKPMKGSHSELHGHLGDKSWSPPTIASFCETPARAGYNTEMGHEYLDSPKVLKEKVKLLAQILLKAKKTVIYAGAGLSTASGIGDYATQTGKSGVLAQSGQKGAVVSPFCVSPNFGHHCIAALSKKGYIHKFVQQNHDGLPQKAGMNQGLINEIHGGWFDPSNPVVAMSGGLRSDLFEDLLNLEKETDFVIAVGSSLCGMNADRLVSSSAQRAKQYRKNLSISKRNQSSSSSLSSSSSSWLYNRVFGNSTHQTSSQSNDSQKVISQSGLKPEFGSVIISLQKTVHDHNSSLRIFALIDDVFKLLAEELNLDMTTQLSAYLIKNPTKYCENCSCSEEKIVLKACLRCERAYYCSKECQTKHWKKTGGHQKTCIPINSGGANDVNDDEDVFLIPYNEQGLLEIKKRNDKHVKLMKLDLRVGSELSIAHGSDKGTKAMLMGKNNDGHYKLSVERKFKSPGSQRTFTETRLLGKWWPLNAMDGDVEYIPVVNRSPEFVSP